MRKLFATCDCFDLFSVYFVQVSFNSGIDSAVLISPWFNVSSTICLTFYYRITTTQISLSIMTSSLNNNLLKTVSTLSYADQSKPDSWNKAAVPLANGIIRLALVANKTGVSVDRHFVAVDRINLAPYSTCITPGILLCYWSERSKCWNFNLSIISSPCNVQWTANLFNGDNNVSLSSTCEDLFCQRRREYFRCSGNHLGFVTSG